MIGFTRSEQKLLRAVTVCAPLLFIGAAVYLCVVPPPRSAVSTAAYLTQEANIRQEVAADEQEIGQTQVQIGDDLWKCAPQAVSATLLARITSEARSQGLTLSGFRPQRTEPIGTIEEVPFIVELSGPYPKVRTVADLLDSQAGKTVLSSIDISSADAKSNTVTATLGVSAYVSTPADQSNPEGPHA